MKFSLGILFVFIPVVLYAQNDSIWMKNNDILVGELKTLSKSVVTFKTSYSDKDFKIDFNEVTAFSTERLCVVNLTDGTRYTGRIKSTSKGNIEIVGDNGDIYEVSIQEIIFLEEISQRFWKRFSGAFDIALNLSKTNNNKQFTFTGNLKYTSDRWNFKTAYNVLYSDQDNVDRIERKEASLSGLRYFNKWFVSTDISYLSSTEQGIQNRINPGIGFGRTLVTTSKLYWLAGSGLNYNIEEYYDQTLNKESTELQLLTQFEIYNVEDFSLFTRAIGYPSLSERGRFRLDYNLVLKYDLPFDIYIKADFTLNYDNQPAIEGNFTDYVFSTGIGWELKN
jgi:Protein of unknown function, DUF481